jgi:fatty acid desaturase
VISVVVIVVQVHVTYTPNATTLRAAAISLFEYVWYHYCTASIQVTHHLYPGVSQYHYPAIAPIIKQTCKEYGIEYKCLPTFAAAFHAHIKHLKNMGARGEPAELHMG